MREKAAGSSLGFGHGSVSGSEPFCTQRMTVNEAVQQQANIEGGKGSAAAGHGGDFGGGQMLRVSRCRAGDCAAT